MPGGSFYSDIWIPLILAVSKNLESLRIPNRGTSFITTNAAKFVSVRKIQIVMRSISDIQLLSLFPHKEIVKYVEIDSTDQAEPGQSGIVLDLILSTFPYVEEIRIYPPFSEKNNYVKFLCLLSPISFSTDPRANNKHASRDRLFCSFCFQSGRKKCSFRLGLTT